MKIAELFISLGVSGATQTKNTLSDTRKGLQETTSSALWAKAAIVGVLYGLERLVSGSNRAGADLQQFANYAGLSAEKLQRYAYAGRQFGATAEEIKGNILGIQKAMAQLDTTGQGPAGLWVVSREVGLDKTRMRDAFYLMDKLQEFAQKSKLPTGIANQALESFGLSAGTIAAMRKNAFNPELMAQANIYSDKEAANLAKMNAMWGNLGDKIQKSIGHLNSKHGGQLIRDISTVADKVLLLTDRLVTLSTKLKVFELIGKSFEGWAIILDHIAERVDTINKGGDKPEDRGFWNKLLFDTESLAKEGNSKGAFDGAKADIRNWSYLIDEKLKASYTIPVAAGEAPVTVNQTNNFNGTGDVRDAIPDLKKATSDSVRQSQALRRKH